MGALQQHHEVELYALLSDHCNFQCAHCVNDSGPLGKRWRFSNQSLELLVENLNHNAAVTSVNFSGGEPTLLKKSIVSLQSRVTRPLRYSLTTNGWMGADFAAFLKDVKLDAVTLSYDKYHQPFVTERTLLEFARVVVDRHLPLQLNLVYETLKEIALAQPFVELGATLKLTPLVRGGRAKDLADSVKSDHFLQSRCPSLEIAKRGMQMEKVVYVPERGFTSCCGPLAFDHAPTKNLWKKDVKAHFANPFREVLSETFGRQAERLGFDLREEKFASPCDVCETLYAPLAADLPSLSELSQQVKATEYYPTRAKLGLRASAILSQQFAVDYVYVDGKPDQLAFLRLQRKERLNKQCPA